MPVRIPDEDTARAFARELEARRRAGREVGATLVCDRCNWTIAESEARARGIKVCQRCGHARCRVVALPYNLGIPENERPADLREAERWSRQDRPDPRRL